MAIYKQWFACFTIVVFLLATRSAEARRRRPRPPDTNTETNTSAQASADIGFIHLRSCSSASASSTGGSGSAYSGAIAVGIDQAAASCADAFAEAIASNCNGNAYVSAFTVAESCASALASVYVESWASVYTTGGSVACASSCASGNAAASSYSAAFGAAFGEAFQGCSEVAGYVESETFTSVFVQVMGSVFTNACAENGGSAEAGASAFIRTAAASLAVAYADVWGYACTEGCLGSCGYCALIAEDLDITGAAAYVSGGTYALAEAMGQTVHAACDRGTAITTADVDVLVEAYVGFCLKIVAKLNNWVRVNPRIGEAYACSGGAVSANVEYAASAAAYGWAWAWRKNFDGCGSAFTDAEADAFASDVISKVFIAYQHVCGDKGRNTKTTHIVRHIISIVNRDPFAQAVASAYAEVANNCPCSKCFCPCRCSGNDCKCTLLY